MKASGTVHSSCSAKRKEGGKRKRENENGKYRAKGEKSILGEMTEIIAIFEYLSKGHRDDGPIINH